MATDNDTSEFNKHLESVRQAEVDQQFEKELNKRTRLNLLDLIEMGSVHFENEIIALKKQAITRSSLLDAFSKNKKIKKAIRKLFKKKSKKQRRKKRRLRAIASSTHRISLDNARQLQLLVNSSKIELGALPTVNIPSVSAVPAASKSSISVPKTHSSS